MGDQTLNIDALIGRARENREFLGSLLECYRPYLLLVSRQQLNPKVAVRCSPSDIVQETVAEAAHKFEQFCGSVEAEFSAWIAQIHQHNLDDAARRHLLAKQRNAEREERLDKATSSASFTWREIAAHQKTPSDVVVAGEKALRLAKILQSLPEAQGEAIQLRHMQGLSVAEIAEQMDRSPPAVAGLLKRGLRELRRRMSEDSWF